MSSDKPDIRCWGTVPYEMMWQRMQHTVRARTHESRDAIWLCEHPSVFTLGRSGDDDHIISAGDIPVIRSDRGGQVTYHGPGQIVCYPLIALMRRGFGVRRFVSYVEEVVIATLAAFGISASSRPTAPGVYVGAKKIASLGIKVSRGISYHGLALNYAMDLTPFDRIHPCGFTALRMTDMATETTLLPSRSVVEAKLLEYVVSFLPSYRSTNA